MRRPRPPFPLVLSFLVAATPAVRADAKTDALAAEVARLDSFLRGNRATDELWQDIKKSTEPALARTQAALGAGRRWLALQRLGSVGVNLDAAAYVQQRPPEQRKEIAAFEKEWGRMG